MAEKIPLLVLPGALGVADGGHAAALFADQRSVVSFTYRQDREIDRLLDRAAALMTDIGAVHFDVIGFSIGGWFAQCLAAREPTRVRRIVLAHSFALAPADATLFALASKLWPVLPSLIFRAALMKRARMALWSVRNVDVVMYETLLRGVSDALASPAIRAQLVAQQDAARDSLLEMGACTPLQPVLIVESNDDRLVGEKQRERLRRKYPEAEQLVLNGAGHASALSMPDVLTAAVEAFLEARDPRRSAW